MEMDGSEGLKSSALDNEFVQLTDEIREVCQNLDSELEETCLAWIQKLEAEVGHQ